MAEPQRFDDSATILVDHYRAVADKPTGKNQYRGLRIHALAGLHDQVGALARNHFQAQGRVVDALWARELGT